MAGRAALDGRVCLSDLVEREASAYKWPQRACFEGSGQVRHRRELG